MLRDVVLASKYNEDMEIPRQYILEFWRNTNVVTSQSDLNKWESGWMMAIDNCLFVKDNQYLSKMHALQLDGHVVGLKSYTIIDNYFKEPQLTQGED